MSDFPYDMGDDRTVADDRLDQILASTDAELLEAISVAQTGRRSPDGPSIARVLPGEDRRPMQDELPRQKDGTDHPENTAVTRALLSLATLSANLRFLAVGFSPQSAVASVVEHAREEVAALYVSLEARDLNKEEALSRLDDVWEMLEVTAVEVGGQMAAAVRKAWERARQAVLVLFEHSDDHEGRPVPSPH